MKKVWKWFEKRENIGNRGKKAHRREVKMAVGERKCIRRGDKETTMEEYNQKKMEILRKDEIEGMMSDKNNKNNSNKTLIVAWFGDERRRKGEERCREREAAGNEEEGEHNAIGVLRR